MLLFTFFTNHHSRCNLEMVALEDVDDLEDQKWLKAIVQEFEEKTGSTLAASLLDNWQESLAAFVKVFPHEYRRALQEAEMEAEMLKLKKVCVFVRLCVCGCCLCI